jgi:AcrR family transcriptional regulator
VANRRHRGALRQGILDAADRLLFELGDAHQVSIEAVVDVVGCTPPALYYYFPSKEQLLREVCRRQYLRFAEMLESAVPRTGTVVEELIARGHAYLDWATSHPEHYRILFMTPIGSPPAEDDADPRQSAGLAELIDNLERGIAEGSFKPGDPLLMALMLWSAVHGMASLAVVNPALPGDLAHAVVELTGRSVIGGFTTSAPPHPDESR